MANAPNTQSTLSSINANKTSTGLSTNILIMVNGTPVGAVKSMAINEKRNITMVNEVGTDGSIDSCPTSSTTISGTCQRVRFDRLRVAEAFGRGFIHVASQVYPFDIVLLDRQKRDGKFHILTTVRNVWISGIDYTYDADNWIVSESMSWNAERIDSTMGGKAVANGGERGIAHLGAGTGGTTNIISANGVVNIEQLADTGSGGRGGSFDSGGIIDLSEGVTLF